MLHMLALFSILVHAPTPPPETVWPQWRGPTRDGIVPAKSAPREWPGTWRQGWKVEVGEGYSSPVASNGKVFIHGRIDPDEVVTAIELETGRTAWQKKYPAAFGKNPYATKMAKGPYATPLVAGERLFTLGGSGHLSAWRVTDGSLLWRNDYSASVETSKLFCGTSASPLMEGGLLIVQVGSDAKGGRILALDPANGHERWSWKGPGPGYASPIAITVEGSRQIVTLTESSVVGIDAKSGAGIWAIPFPDEWHENIVTPVWTGKHLIVSGTRQGTHAYALRREANAWKTTEAWHNTVANMYMSSPVLVDGALYGHSNKKRGHFFAMDPETGAILWATEGRDGDHASVLATGGYLLYLTDGSKLVVAKRTPTSFEAVKSYDLRAGATWAVPLLTPDGIVIRGASEVIGFRAK